jgi:hypothetical protein
MGKDFLTEIGISLNLLLAGFFGALLLVKKQGKTWKDNLMTLVTGSFSATYVAPFLLEMLNIQSKNASTFFGFLVGFGSIRILDLVINKYFKSDNGSSE